MQFLFVFKKVRARNVIKVNCGDEQLEMQTLMNPTPEVWKGKRKYNWKKNKLWDDVSVVFLSLFGFQRTNLQGKKWILSAV